MTTMTSPESIAGTLERAMQAIGSGDLEQGFKESLAARGLLEKAVEEVQEKITETSGLSSMESESAARICNITEHTQFIEFPEPTAGLLALTLWAYQVVGEIPDVKLLIRRLLREFQNVPRETNRVSGGPYNALLVPTVLSLVYLHRSDFVLFNYTVSSKNWGELRPLVEHVCLKTKASVLKVIQNSYEDISRDTLRLKYCISESELQNWRALDEDAQYVVPPHEPPKLWEPRSVDMLFKVAKLLETDGVSRST